jgi:hypothetical protein
MGEDEKNQPNDELTVVQDETKRARSQDRSAELPAPEVPGYDIKRRLGAGSYGEVWLAVQKNTGREVAIKFFSRFKGLDWPLLKREVGKLVEVLGERRVVHLLQVGWDAEPPYYVMEYLPGGSLADRLDGRTLPTKDTVAVFREVAEALVYLHGKAILHCDLKPANVLLDDHNQIRLADFGQARMSNEAGPAVGTLFYMAPEQANSSARPDVRSDIYSLGALVYTMLTGAPPHSSGRAKEELSTSRSTQERIERYRKLIDASDAPRAHHAVEGVDRALAEILDRCLAKDPDARYENVQQVLEALSARDKQRTQRPLVVFGLLGPLALVVAMAAVGVWAWFQAEAQARDTLTRQNLEGALGYGQLISTVVDRNLTAAERGVSREADQPELHRLMATPGSRELQSYADELYETYEDRFFHNWVITDSNAVVLARAPFDEGVVGARYAYREWFTGVEDIPRNASPEVATPRTDTGLTLAFESTASGNPILVSVASPIVSESKLLGVLMATLHLETFNAWLEEAEGPPTPSGCPPRFAVLLNRGQLVRHPCPAGDAAKPPVGRAEYFERGEVQSLMDTPEGFTDAFADPLRGGVAYFAAVVEFKDNPDWATIVQRDRAEAMSPITQLGAQFGTLGWIAAGVAFSLILVLWALLYRVIHESSVVPARGDLVELEL